MRSLAYALHQPGSADTGIVDDHIADGNKSAFCWEISYSCEHAKLVHLSSIRKTESQNISTQVKPTVLDFTHHTSNLLKPSKQLQKLGFSEIQSQLIYDSPDPPLLRACTVSRVGNETN